MADEGDGAVEGVSFVLPRFNTVYNLMMQQLKFKERKSAKESYSRLLQLYNSISNSEMSYIDKQDAYQKLQAAHQQLYKPEGVITFENVIIPITLVMIVLIIVFFVKPQLVGVTGFFTAQTENSAPVWDAEYDYFRIHGKSQISLDDYFSDADGDRLTYVASDAKNLRVFISGNKAILIPDEGISGVRYIAISASDLQDIARKNVKIVIE